MSLTDDNQVSQLAEAIHRARNDLSTIASMLQLQAKLSRNEAVAEALKAAELRVMAIARVNAALDDAVHAEPRIDVMQFLTGMAGDLQEAAHGRPITIRAVAGSKVLLGASYARPLGLIVNEWVTNALKYAFPAQRAGTVTIALHATGQECALSVADDGIGMDPAAAPQGTGLGTRLVRGLARQIGGTIAYEAPPAGGTRWTLTFTETRSEDDPADR